MDKKEKIIQSAIQVFQEKGVEKSKVSDIVRRAGIAQGTFYLYFPSRLAVMPDIASFIVGEILQTLEEKIDQNQAFERQLEQLVNAVFTLTDEKRDLVALLYAGLAQTEYIKQWEDIYAPYYKWMAEFLRQAQQLQNIRPTINVERTAKLMIALIETTSEQLYLYDDCQEEEINLQKKELLQFMHHALILPR